IVAEYWRNNFKHTWKYTHEIDRQIPTLTNLHWARTDLGTLHVEPYNETAEAWNDISTNLHQHFLHTSPIITAWTDGSFKKTGIDAPMSWAAFFLDINRSISGKVEGKASST